jgi:hypothetical protein
VLWRGEERRGKAKTGDKIRSRVLITLFITIRLLHDSDHGPLSHNSLLANQDHTVYYAYVTISFKVTYYFV